MKKITFLGASILLFLNAYSQDQTLVNPGYSLLNTNPSFAGSNNSIRNQFVLRTVEPSMTNNYASFYNGLDAYAKRLHGGIALSAMTENIENGLYRSSQLNLVYAPHFECQNSGLKIIPSIQLSYLQIEQDISRLTFGSGWAMWTPGAPPSQKKYGFDASAGLLFNYKNFYAGGSVFHINQPDVSLVGTSKLPSRYSVNVSYNWPLNKNTLINFCSVYSQQMNYRTIQFAANAVFLRRIVAGLGAVSSDVIFANLGYRGNYFMVTAGYDITYSKLAGNTSGHFQVALAGSLHKKEKSNTPLAFEKW